MSRKEMTVYTYIPRGNTASHYYRIKVPFETFRDLGLPFKLMVDSDSANIQAPDRVKAFCEADLALLYQPIGESTLHNSRVAKSFFPSKREDGWKWPPLIVVDSDDNLFNVNPYNVAFRGLGIRDHAGNDIKSGQVIGDVRDGQKNVLWHDGECLPSCQSNPCPKRIDLQANRNNLATYRGMLELSDAVTTSTPHVAQSIEKDAMPRRVRVFPNLVRFDHYEQVDLAPDPKRLKIMWQGGASHYEDWYPLREVLGKITKKYKHVHWVIWGQLYHWVTEKIPSDRYTFVNWAPYNEYKLRLAMMGHDINLAPLHDDRFNRCRSAIKFYEGSVLKKPAATLAQATGPYQDEIIPDQTGLLFKTPEEFEAQLSRLIEDATLRQTLAENAKAWVSERRDAMKHAPKLAAFYEELRETQKREQPHMPETQWERFIKQVEEQQQAEEEARKNGSVEQTVGV